MDDKLRIEIEEIIECKNYLGLFVFNPEEKIILRDLFLEEGHSFSYICGKYGIAEDHLLEITRTFENVKAEFEMLKKENVKVRNKI